MNETRICNDVSPLDIRIVCTFPYGHGPVDPDNNGNENFFMDHGSPEKGAWWNGPVMWAIDKHSNVNEVCGDTCEDDPTVTCTFVAGHGMVGPNGEDDDDFFMDHGSPEQGAWWNSPPERTPEVSPSNWDEIADVDELNSLNLPEKTILTSRQGQTYLLNSDNTVSVVDFLNRYKGVIPVAYILFPVCVLGVPGDEGDR